MCGSSHSAIQQRPLVIELRAQPERVQELMTKVYTRRKGEPEEVAEAIRWLALDAPPIINGAVVDITDGSFLR